jgi:4-hydroxy-tetrahydrodipicolinate synthase
MADTVGVITPCITLFADDGSIDFDATREHLEWLIDAGIHAVLVNGTCGEFYALELEEREQLTERFVEWVDGRIPVFVGVMHTSTAIAVRLAQHAERAGATSVMSVSPYYSSPPEREVLQYFRDIAESVQIPFMLYNNPPASGVDLSVLAIAGLAQDGSVAMIKESHGDAARIHDLKLTVPDDVPVIYGEDYGSFEAICGGADGWVAGVSNFMPHECVRAWELTHGGDLAAAREHWYRMLPLVNMTSIKPLFGRPDERPDFIAIYKAALEELGRTGGPLRRPLLPLLDEDLAYLRGLLADANIGASAAKAG